VGALLGARIVSRPPRLQIRLAMGAALMAAAMVMTLTQLQLIPGGGDSLGSPVYRCSSLSWATLCSAL
jgi:hypothetical protein